MGLFKTIREPLAALDDIPVHVQDKAQDLEPFCWKMSVSVSLNLPWACHSQISILKDLKGS